MPTKQQLESALFNADKAGDTQAAKQLANELKAGSFEVPRGTISQTEPQRDSFIGRVSTDFKERGQELGKNLYNLKDDLTGVMDDPARAKLALHRAPLRVTGAVIGGAGDVIGEGVSTASEYIPDAIADPVKSMAASLIKTQFGQSVSDAILGGAEMYAEFKKQNPKEARDVEDIFNVASILPAAKLAKVGAKAVPVIAKKSKDLVLSGSRELSTFANQSKTKQKIAQLLIEGSTDAQTAGFKLKPKTKINEYLKLGVQKVEKDAAAGAAIKQGFDKGVVAAIKGASPQDRSIMLRMVNEMERVRKNAKYGMTHRPSDIAGDSLLKRFNVIKAANKKAGRSLDHVAKSLKGKGVDVDGPINNFIKNLDDSGITISDDLSLNFKGSDIEGLTGNEAAIKRLYTRMNSKKALDAYDVHRLKRYIDEQVTYGKTSEGLTGKTESLLKGLRRDLDNALDSNFPRYDKVNSSYAETIEAINSLQGVAGKKMNLTGENSSKAVGTLMRRIMSNTQSRVNLLDSVNMIEEVSKKYGARHSDDLMTQLLFVDELDSVFKPVARTSFQGQIRQAVDSAASTAISPAATAIKAAGRGAEKLRGINEDGAFKAIKALLKEPK